MDSNSLRSGGLKPGDGMGDFMRFTTDAPWPDGVRPSPPDGFTRWPANEPAIRRLSRIGMFRRTAGRGLRRLV
jgi:hypothetical protein